MTLDPSDSDFPKRIPDHKISAETKELADKLLHFVNRWGPNETQALAQLLASYHPTSEQGVMRFFVAFCRYVAAEHPDLRNQASHDLAHYVLSSGLTYLPFI